MSRKTSCGPPQVSETGSVASHREQSGKSRRTPCSETAQGGGEERLHTRGPSQTHEGSEVTGVSSQPYAANTPATAVA